MYIVLFASNYTSESIYDAKAYNQKLYNIIQLSIHCSIMYKVGLVVTLTFLWNYLLNVFGRCVDVKHTVSCKGSYLFIPFQYMIIK